MLEECLRTKKTLKHVRGDASIMNRFVFRIKRKILTLILN